jgi:ParB family chromosome partitioning protein
MRDGKKTPDIANILPSVRARGIIVPLIVREKTGPFSEGDSGDTGVPSYEISRRSLFPALIVSSRRQARSSG